MQIGLAMNNGFTVDISGCDTKWNKLKEYLRAYHEDAVVRFEARECDKEMYRIASLAFEVVHSMWYKPWEEVEETLKIVKDVASISNGSGVQWT